MRRYRHGSVRVSETRAKQRLEDVSTATKVLLMDLNNVKLCYTLAVVLKLSGILTAVSTLASMVKVSAVSAVRADAWRNLISLRSPLDTCSTLSLRPVEIVAEGSELLLVVKVTSGCEGDVLSSPASFGRLALQR